LIALGCLASAGWTFSAEGIAGAAFFQAAGVQGGGGRGVNPTLPQQPPQKGTALVLGQVVDATSGQPIAEAIVTVQSRIPITGADGQFVLHDLPKTNLLINVTAPGYVNGGSGQSRPGGTSRPLEVEDGQRLTDAKIRLWKNAVMTGTVTDEAGEPAIGISVRAIRRTSGPAGRQGGGAGFATTDDRGVYRISSLTPGDYYLAVPQALTTQPIAQMNAMLQSMAAVMPQMTEFANMAAAEMASPRGAGMRVGNLMVRSDSGALPTTAGDGRVLAYQALFFPSATSASDASVVTLGSGEERAGLDMQMKLIRTARVSGTLMGATGPAANTMIRLQSLEVERSGSAGFDVATAMTDADGTFTFLGVPSGQYVARATVAARPTMPGELAGNAVMQMALGRMGGGPVATYAHASVSVASDDVTGLALRLIEGAKVSGKLEFDGSAPPPQPQQFQQFNVSLTPVGGTPAPGATPGRAGQDGTFTTSGYPAGRYYLNPAARGGGAWVLRSATSGGRDVLNDPLEIGEADITDVVITYTDKIGQVNGTVRLDSNAPSMSVTVIMFPADYRSWIARGMNNRLLRNLPVPKGGAFTAANVQAGDYIIAALDDADIPDNQDTAFFEALARLGTRVSLKEGDRPSVDLSIVKVRR
jgi:protocatechuate 3,4-dioxygenase beta subunit